VLRCIESRTIILHSLKAQDAAVSVSSTCAAKLTAAEIATACGSGTEAAKSLCPIFCTVDVQIKITHDADFLNAHMFTP
jgi:hypothetical protein